MNFESEHSPRHRILEPIFDIRPTIGWSIKNVQNHIRLYGILGIFYGPPDIFRYGCMHAGPRDGVSPGRLVRAENKPVHAKKEHKNQSERYKNS